jgi:asparagine synthase (glutamine-hydrolysing)
MGQACGGVATGHRRLSIIDLSDRASQPMTIEDGRLVIVFKGEIYNNPEPARASVAFTMQTGD